MKTLKTLSGVAVALAAATPALAHDGEHSHGFVATIIHWLSFCCHWRGRHFGSYLQSAKKEGLNHVTRPTLKI